ncbi:MAG: VOC family protein [Patescibacteria group bacterium]
MDIKQIIGDYKKFLNKIFDYIKKLKIDVSNYELDHMCFRVENKKQYDSIKKEMQNFGQLISEKNIRNRTIVVFKLNKALVYKHFNISYIEIPAPSEHKNYKRGLQHIEFVINTSKKIFIKKHPQLNFEQEKLSGRKEPELKLKFGELAVKFHLKNVAEEI